MGTTIPLAHMCPSSFELRSHTDIVVERKWQTSQVVVGEPRDKVCKIADAQASFKSDVCKHSSLPT